MSEQITKYRVTMTNAYALPGGQVRTEQAVDYVPVEQLDGYIADAQSRWQSVERSDEPDAGPGGYDGDTNIPAGLGGN